MQCYRCRKCGRLQNGRDVSDLIECICGSEDWETWETGEPPRQVSTPSEVPYERDISRDNWGSDW